MADIKWTPSQRAAIDTRGRNILVSAAAGSGKTAVLVERIINRVMRDRDKTDIDRMLIVTFTNAAAAEMKEKINKRLRGYERRYRFSERKIKSGARAAARRYESDAAEQRRRRYEQMSALDDADICTIDSFCKRLVQSFAHELDISPDFRLYDPAEDEMVIDETAEKLIERCYNTNDERFMRLTEYYSSMRNDDGLKNMIAGIYKFLQSYAEPTEKLDEIFSCYGESADTLFESVWARELMREQKNSARRVIMRLMNAENGSAEDLLSSPRIGLAHVFADVMLLLCGSLEFCTEESHEAALLLADAVLAGDEALFESTLKKNADLLRNVIFDGGKVHEAVSGLFCYAAGVEPERRLIALCERYEKEICEACGAESTGYLFKITDKYVRPLYELVSSDEISGEESWNAIYDISFELLHTSAPKPRKTKKNSGEYNEEIIAELDLMKKNCLSGFDFSYVDRRANEVKIQYEQLSRQAEDIKALVAELMEDVRRIKSDRNVYSFADIEHMAYRLVTEQRYGDIAAMCRERYTDILIDEYQDTNGLQDAIFSGISNGRNVFMVGDLKQSIYAFRGGDPSIFKKKSAEYTPYAEADKNGCDPVRIDLADNFRSNVKVVDAVNELFGYVMTEELGDVDYNKKGERLVCGRLSGDSEEQKKVYMNKKSELVLLPFIRKQSDSGMENGEEIDRTDIEARYVAGRIRDMVDSHEKIIADGTVRDIEYRDFTIIASSVKSIINVYSDALDEQGIPLAIPSIGYYSFFEISVVLSFLRVIANRRRDVPLVTVMRSPIGGFTDEELAQISAAGRGRDFFGRMQSIIYRAGQAAERLEPLPVERALLNKIGRFIALIDRFDSYKHYKTVAAIVYSIYTETGFYDFVGAMDGGKLAQQNLTLFYEKAKKFEAGGAGSLYSFVKYIEKLREENDNEEGAPSASESQNAVRMMTIHASKGLEFPVVFMVSCGKNFRRESSEDGKINREAGIGLYYLDPERKTRAASPLYRWVSLRNRRENRSEDVRKLYVGMTRARERLICVISKNSSPSKYKAMVSRLMKMGRALADSTADGYSAANLVNAEGFTDWIMPSYFAGVDENGTSPWQYNPDISAEDYLSRDVYGIIGHTYKFSRLTSLPSKTTVSKVKEERSGDGGYINAKRSAYAAQYATGLDKLPESAVINDAVQFDNRAEISSGPAGKIPANLLGTAYHKVMELVNPLKCADEDEVTEQIEELCREGFIDNGLAAGIKSEYVSAFFTGHELGMEAVSAYKSGRLYRETPFEIEITPAEYSDEITEGEYLSDDKILLQGTIDCWFKDGNGDVYIIDYKTDRYKGGYDDEDGISRFCSEKAEEYSVQLDLYARALEKALDDGERIDSKVKGKYLYLFAVDRFVKVD
ncbi:MAG: UvrD-helicase domain-containing protein [bacterium]|nr:UvrD-helicase domain-containing protein [bacterium]